MPLLNFFGKKEKIQESNQVERTTNQFVEQLESLAANGEGGIVGFKASVKILSITSAEITVLGLTDSHNVVGLGLPQLQTLCDFFNSELQLKNQPLVVRVKEEREAAPRTFDGDYVTNVTYTLVVTTAE